VHQDPTVHSVPADVIAQSFSDVEATLPGPQQEGLTPIAEYPIVPTPGKLHVCLFYNARSIVVDCPESVFVVIDCLDDACLLTHRFLQVAGNKSTFNFNSVVLLYLKGL
jgi:hypothetical protein